MIFSATKAIVATAMWIVLDEGSVKVDETVAHYIPEFAEHGKDTITVEQVMLHTSGFPRAPLVRRSGTHAQDGSKRRALAAQLGAGHALRVPPDVGALGAR